MREGERRESSGRGEREDGDGGCIPSGEGR